MEPKAGFVGLVTATGEVSANPGALRVADNVTLRRQGALTSRPSWQSVNTPGPGAGYRDVVYYQGGYVYLGSGNQSLLNVANASNIAVQYIRYTAGASAPATLPLLRNDMLGAVQARGNLYFPSDAGVFKMQSVGAAQLEPAGIVGTVGVSLLAVNTSTSAGTPWLAVASQVAYRFVARYDAPNGLVLRSRPSGQVLAVNASGSIANVYLTLTTGGIKTPITAIEIYRTRTFPNTVTPDDEMQLVGTLDIAGTGSGSFGDAVPDVLRTTTLYTSPSRGGIENANDRPPACAAIERFRGALFFGNTKGPHRAIVSFKYGGDRTGTATGLGYRTATGNVTNGSTAIGSVSNTTGLAAGMYVRGNGLSTSAPTYITSVVGSTVNITPAAVGTFAGTSLTFYDTAIVEGTIRIPLIANSGTAPAFSFTAFNTYVAYEVSPPAPGYQATMVLERRYPSDPAFTVTQGTNFADTNVPTAGIASTQDVLPNGLAWSAPDEPEHVPPKNYTRVGDQGRAILGLRTTREALYIFKEDGVFRLSGVDGGYRVDPLDPTALCVLPSSIRRLRNAVLFLASTGLVEIANDVVRVVSLPVQNELARIVSAIRASQAASGNYFLPGFVGNAATVDEPNGEYLLALGSTTQAYGGQMLVYASGPGGFTTYTLTGSAPTALALSPLGEPVFLTATTHLELSGTPGAYLARVAAHAFTDPALVGKLWTHVAVGFSTLIGASFLTARFSGAVPMPSGTTVDEDLDVPLDAGIVRMPEGSLLRHPVPNVFRRAWSLRLEMRIVMDAGVGHGFVLELLGAESRENAPNHNQQHATGGT